MIPLRYKKRLLISGLFLFLVSPHQLSAFPLWRDHNQPEGTAAYVYEEDETEKEKKRYVTKLEQDAQKCDLAIANTKTLIRRSKNRPYMPELYLRLAELHIEKSRLVYFLRKSQQPANEQKALDQYEANNLKTQAIEFYQRIVSQYPQFAHLDKVHFFMAHEYHELGRIDEMIVQYRTLLKKYPRSMYAPEAHLLLGDYYFNQKQDLETSTKHYQAVLGYPKSTAVAAARYKLAWCKINQADYKGALKLFEASVTSPQSSQDLDIDTYRRVDVRLESLVDMAYCYPEVYKKATAKEALSYFKQYAWSRPVYTTVLEKLAYRYYVKKKWRLAAPLYRELAMIRQDPEALLMYAKHLFESVQAIGTYEQAEKDVAIIVRALKRQVYSVHLAQADKEKLLHDYEIFARDIITHLHEKARKTNSRKDFTIASDAYDQYLEFFTKSPANEKMAANYAEALFSAERYVEAGKQYEKVTPSATVNAKQRRQCLYSAIISYYQALKHKEALTFYQTAYAREGMRSIGKRFVEEYPQSPQVPDVSFNVAWAAYDAGDFKTALKDLSAFIQAHPTHKAAGAAVHLVLDAYHQLEDYEGLIRYGNSVLANKRIQDARLKAEIAQIVESAGSKVVSSITVAVNDDWESARQELLQVADQSGQTKMGEQALHALILSSKDKNDLATLFDAGDRLLAQYPQSSHAKATLDLLIGTSATTGQLRQLASYLETKCRKYPREENAPDFLLQAAQIQEGLGHYARANASYRRLLTYPPTSANSLDEIVFTMVDNLERLDQPAAAIKLLAGFQKKLSREGQRRAYAKLAILYQGTDQRSQAEKYSRLAQKACSSNRVEQDPQLRDLMAQLTYNQVYGNSAKYYQLRLKSRIDNAIVQQKSSLLGQLEEGYQKVLAYQSPTWALKACFRAHELNAEFADFLINAPVPQDLTSDQQAQYRQLIRQKAQAYQDKANQYVQTCLKMAEKWEICDPELSGYFLPREKPQGKEGAVQSVSGRKTISEICAQGPKQSDLSTLFVQLLEAPDDAQLQLRLARAYLKMGDYPQAGLVAQNALPTLDKSQRQVKAELLNLVGLSHLYGGRDPLAKEAFKKALKSNNRLAAARLNLAGIYRHYGHEDKASALLQEKALKNLDPDGIHPGFGSGHLQAVSSSEANRAAVAGVKP